MYLFFDKYQSLGVRKNCWFAKHNYCEKAENTGSTTDLKNETKREGGEGEEGIQEEKTQQIQVIRRKHAVNWPGNSAAGSATHRAYYD